MLLCKKVSLCKSSLKIRMGCSHDLLSVLQRGWLVPGTSVGRNINPACFFERPLWSGNESLLAFLERPPWSKKYHDSASLPWPSPEARNDAVRPRNDAVRPRGAGNIRIPLRLRGSRRRRVLTGGPREALCARCVPVENGVFERGRRPNSTGFPQSFPFQRWKTVWK